MWWFILTYQRGVGDRARGVFEDSFKLNKNIIKYCLPFVWASCVCMPDLSGHTFIPERQDQWEI